MLRTLAFLLAMLATPALAQDWPANAGTIRIIVPYAPGGPLDLPARLLIDRLAALTKGVFILEHRPGAGGSVGAQAVVQSTPDGNTFLFASSSIAAAPALYPKLGFDPLQALVPLSLVTEFPISLAVRADSQISDLADLIAKAKAQPGKYTFGSGGVGTGNHLAGELFKRMAGIDLLHVPFRSVSLGITAMYAGDIDMVFASVQETKEHMLDGRLRILGIGADKRMAELPDVPAIDEKVPGYRMSNWYALFAPRGVPQPILARLESDLATVRNDPALIERAKAAGVAMLVTPPDELRTKMETEIPRWKELIPQLGLKTQ